MKPAGILLAVVLAGGLCPAGAVAAGIGPRGEFGVDAGHADLVEEKGGGAPLAALRGGYHFTSWFELEAEASYLTPDCRQGECSDLWIALINFMFDFHPTQGIAPYLYFGFGYTDFEQQVDSSLVLLQDQFQGQAVYQTGAGSRFFFGQKKRTGFRVEAYETFFEDDQSPGAQAGIVWRLGG